MIYLDNAASTQKKPLSVKLQSLKSVIFNTSNPGRSGHKLSYKNGLEILKARETIKNFFGVPKIENVIFTSSCTEALNLALIGTAKENGHIVSTVNEHNSVLRVLEHLKQTKNISYSLAIPNEQGEIELEEIKKLTTNDTYLIAVNHTSNVTGATSNIKSIGQFANKNKILFLVDSAQSAGHEKINMQDMKINLLALAGHKGLLGIQGVGALLINNAHVNPIKFGGTGTDSKNLKQPSQLPEGLESGTLATPNILCLKKGVEYVEKNFNKINSKIEKLTLQLINELKNNPNITLYSNNAKSGVVTFKVNEFDQSFVANVLNEKFNICVRGGLHCSPLIHKHLNSTGLIRASISHKNKMWEIKKLVKSLNYIIKFL